MKRFDAEIATPWKYVEKHLSPFSPTFSLHPFLLVSSPCSGVSSAASSLGLPGLSLGHEEATDLPVLTDLTPVDPVVQHIESQLLDEDLLTGLQHELSEEKTRGRNEASCRLLLLINFVLPYNACIDIFLLAR